MAVPQLYTGYDEMASPRLAPVPDELLWLVDRADSRLTREATLEFMFDTAVADAVWADAHQPGRSWVDRHQAASGWKGVLDTHAPVARRIRARWLAARAAMWAAAGGAALLTLDLAVDVLALAG